MIYGATTLGITTLNITTLGITKLSLTTLYIVGLFATLSKIDTYHIQHKSTLNYNECWDYLDNMLSVVKLNAVI
jgi:hypothetical protein